ncbi:MAG TPA: hypothetical protein VIL46_01150 [Gemmataceae bacterium]
MTDRETALGVANEAAAAHGADPGESLVAITEETTPAGKVWRVHYGPRDYVSRRGGDLIVLVDGQAGEVQRVIHGQ